MTGAAITYLHLSLDNFNDLTPLEFNEALKAYSTKYKIKNENNNKLLYEVARYIVTQIWNASGRTLKQPIRNPKQMFPFPWEKGVISEGKVQTLEQMKQVMAGIVDLYANKGLKKSSYKKPTPSRQKKAEDNIMYRTR